MITFLSLHPLLANAKIKPIVEKQSFLTLLFWINKKIWTDYFGPVY